MDEKRKVFLRLCNAVGFPLNKQSSNIIFDIKELVDKEGKNATIEQLEEIVDNHTKQTEEHKEDEQTV